VSLCKLDGRCSALERVGNEDAGAGRVIQLGAGAANDVTLRGARFNVTSGVQIAVTDVTRSEKFLASES
jgi:hypothetical protein